MRQLNKLKIFVLPLILILLAVCFGMAVSYSPAHTSGVELKEGWQYKLGDCTKNGQGIPLWVYDEPLSKEWKAFSYPGQPDNPGKVGNVWVRYQLPQSNLHEASILFMTNDQFFEVYLEDKLLYQFGNVETGNDRQAPGSPWHLISLPEGYQGKMLSIRMHTMFPRNAGLVRNAILAPGYEHISHIIRDDMDSVVMSALFTSIGLFLLLTYTLRKSIGSAFLSLGIFSISIGVWLFAESDIKQIFYNNPRFWLYVAFFSFYFTPVGFLSFIEQVFADHKNRLIRMLWMTQIVFTLLTISLDYANIMPIIMTLQPSYSLLFIEIITTALVILKATRRNVQDARIFIIGFTLFAITGVYDILGWFFRIVPWRFHIVPYGMLIFVMSLVYILALRVIGVYEQLKKYSSEIESNNSELSKMYSEIDEYRVRLEDLNKSLEQTVATRTASIKNLMNNVGQGFLSFGGDLLVNDEYSSECINIFGKEIAKANFPELIYPDDAEQRAFLQNILSRILEERSIYQRYKYLPLLPDELQMGDKFIHMVFKIINNGDHDAIMVILTDITDRRCLENRMEQERNTLNMVVKVAVNYGDFIDCVKDFKYFAKRRTGIILRSSRTLDAMVFEVFRNIHTFKGVFAQYDMVHAAKKLHDIETLLSDFNKHAAEKTAEDFKQLLSGLNLSEVLEEDLNILSEILGKNFLNQENALYINKDKLKEIEKKMMSILPPNEYKLLIPDIQRLRFKPFKEILKTFPAYVEKLAERFEKMVNPMIIEGGEMLVDIDKYSGFSKSLVHIFRNSVDHGLEDIDERVSLGKPEYGTIQCRIQLAGDSISLMISDDGRGIDLDKIRGIALEKGFYDEDTLRSMSDESLVNIIFMDEFSTREDASELSGRGIGLPAVMNELRKINGTVKVISVPKEGTTFQFLLPFDTIPELPEISVSAIIKPVAETARYFLQDQIHTTISDFDIKDICKAENILLKEYSAFVNIKGILNGRFVISVDNQLGKRLASNFLLGELTDNEEEYYVEDTLAECANIILGNSVKMLPGIEELVLVEPPTTVSLSDATIRFIESVIWTCAIETSGGNMSISFVSPDSMGF